MQIKYLPTTTSTNDAVRLAAQEAHPDGCFPAGFAIALRTGFQTAGRGQIGNRWESQEGQNLLISVLYRPVAFDVRRQFLMSMAVALSVRDTLLPLLPGEMAKDVKVKWPNDIYVGLEKIAGILIENRLQGRLIADSVIGLGLNVNQSLFVSDAPNPVSVANLSGEDNSVPAVADAFCLNLEARLQQLADEDFATLQRDYMQCLLWADGCPHTFADAGGSFRARIVSVAPDGILTLLADDGSRREYLFKEVEHEIRKEE